MAEPTFVKVQNLMKMLRIGKSTAYKLMSELNAELKAKGYYKDHVRADADSKIITDYTVTSANVHDIKALMELVDETDKVLYADSAYSGTELQDKLPSSVESRIHEKGYRNHPLTEGQKESNRKKSKIRVRIEHIFGYMTMSLHGLTVRSIGIAWATFNAGLTNLFYNLCRYEILCRAQV